MPKFRAIVFDLDDTLYPEREYVLSGFQEVAKRLEPQVHIPRNEVFNQLVSQYETDVRGKTLNRWLADHGLEIDAWLPMLLEIYRNHDPRIALAPEVHVLLDWMKPRFRLGLVSDGRLEQQEKKARALGLNRWFETMIFTDKLGSEFHKPSRRPFELVIERLGVDPGEAAYVADNPAKDFLGARQLGLGTVRIRRRDGVYRDMEPPTADHRSDVEFHNLDELKNWLET